MQSNEEGIWDRAYATINDFLNDNYMRLEDICQTRSPDDVEFHFNKPGFDLALIITHPSLISTINEIQIPLQSTYTFTTHAIYLPDVSRLKFCIRDLKLHEILYALVISENSKEADMYDLYILTNIIEHQMNMSYKEAIDLISDDWTNYTEQLKQLMMNPGSSPHPNNTQNPAFREPSSNIRYLLSLLADYRKLELRELHILRSFINSRKEAIIDMGSRSVNYGLNERPIPSFEQENYKYYIYEHKSNSIMSNEVSRQNIHTTTIIPYQNGIISNPCVQKKSININESTIAESLDKDKYSKNSYIASSPKLYNNSEKTSQSLAKATSKSPNVILSPTNAAPVKNLFIKPSKSKDVHNVKSHEESSKSKCVSGDSNKSQVNKDSNRSLLSGVNVQEPIEIKDKSERKLVENHVINRSNSSSDPAATIIKEELLENSETLSELSPVSSLSSDKLYRRDIDLRKANEKCPNFLSKKARLNSTLEITDLTTEYSAIKSKVTTVTCNLLVNLFKFVLNTSPLQLPSHSEVLESFKTCLVDMEKYVTCTGLSKIVVDMRACRSGGCQDILRIIETVSGDTVPCKSTVLPDLNYMWMYFPRNLSPDNVNVVFYKLMKMIELTKSSPESIGILLAMIQKIEDVVNYNFQLPEFNCFNNLNCFPTLFNEYFSLSTELHRLNATLPAPEPASASLKTDYDKMFIENKIKFIAGPLMEYFVKVINSIHYQLDIQTMEDVFVSFRTLRFCMRKICNRLLPDQIPELVPFSITDDIMARTLELLDEINFVIREVGIMNCILFTKKHYDFINLVLDFSIKIDKCVTDGTEADTCPMDLECLIDLDPTQFLNDFSTNIKTAIYPYHHDTEIEILKKSLKNRWIEILHQAFKGIAPEPDGSRMSKEIIYLLPKGWGKHTFDDSVIKATSLSYDDWNCMLDNDFSTAKMIYSDVRNNYLLWLSKNNLDHKKAMELMTQYQKKLDTKIMSKQQT